MTSSSSPALVTRVVDGVLSVAKASWDVLVEHDENPFVEHAFLALLESSESVGPMSPWQPRTVVVEDDGVVVAAAPAYRRTDSYGEFIFDHGLARASHQLGVAYYPKVTIAVPFTPATGPRLLVAAADARAAERQQALLAGIAALEQSESASSTHVLFCRDDEATLLAQSGYLRRASLQFHWRNDGYATFDDFLSRLQHDERKQIRRERRRVHESGLVVEVRSGADVPSSWWPRLHALYTSTYDRKWGSPYLTRAFFDGIPRVLGDRAVIAVARDPSRPDDDDVMAMTLSFERGRACYGRHWGTRVDVPGLHFELCYYALLERAVARGQTLVEAGAQGEHKLKRGYLPVITHSAHRFAHPRLAAVAARFFAEERAVVVEERDALAAHGPFRAGAAPASPLVAGTGPRGLSPTDRVA